MRPTLSENMLVLCKLLLQKIMQIYWMEWNKYTERWYQGSCSSWLLELVAGVQFNLRVNCESATSSPLYVSSSSCLSWLLHLFIQPLCWRQGNSGWKKARWFWVQFLRQEVIFGKIYIQAMCAEQTTLQAFPIALEQVCRKTWYLNKKEQLSFLSVMCSSTFRILTHGLS